MAKQKNLWPDCISWQCFNKKINHSSLAFYQSLFEQNDFEITNPRIAVKNLQRICEATFILANNVGFQAMTLRQLSKQTGMSMGGLYAYIKSKDDLARLIYSFLDSYCGTMLLELVDDSLPADEKLVALIHSHIYMSELLQPWFYFAYMETKNLSKEHKGTAISSELAMEELLYQSITEGINNKTFVVDANSDEKNLLIASMIKALLQDWYLKRWKYKKRNISVDEYATQVVQITTCYLQSSSTNLC